MPIMYGHDSTGAKEVRYITDQDVPAYMAAGYVLYRSQPLKMDLELNGYQIIGELNSEELIVDGGLL